MRTARVAMLLGMLLAGACTPTARGSPRAGPGDPTPAKARTLMVFAASSLTDAFTEIGRGFEDQNPGARVVFNFAGSQALEAQIQEGAVADVFASANPAETDTLISEGLLSAATLTPFVTNQLVVVLPPANPAKVASLQDLRRPGLRLVLAAEDVPVGKYSRDALRNMDGQFGPTFSRGVLANVVSNEDNVKQVVAKVQLGEADAGVVYTSDAIAAPDLQTLEIPADVNVIAEYLIGPLARSSNAELAMGFVRYVLTGDAQAILKRWGFGVPP